MTREQAIEIVKSQYPHDHVMKTALGLLIPELRESEDEMIRRTLVEYFGPNVQLDFVRGVPIQKIRDWLEKQKPAIWSEEDETILDSVIRIITQYDDLAHEPTFAGPKWTHPYTKEIAWLKSLRPSWKPSEEQMEALRIASTASPTDSYILSQLYEQLKKL